MRKILLITYAFSPIATPESFLSAKLFSKLRKTKTDVVTIDYPIPGMIDLDPSLEDYIKLNFNKIYRLKLNNLFKIFCYLKIKKIFPFPDFYRLLNNSMYNFIINNINYNKYDYIITWSQSHSIHLVGLKLKLSHGIKNWCAYFSDPWSDNPFFNRSYFGLEKFLNLLNEKKVILAADKIICTSKDTKNLMCKKYKKSLKYKFYIIPHSYDPKLYPNNIKSHKKKIVLFRYIGKFYGKRFPNILLKALKIIEKKNFYIFNKIRIEVYGSQNFLVNLRFYRYKKYINLMGPVSYFNSLDKMKKSDYLLVIDAPFLNSVFFPSKLVDYIGSGKKVIGITPNGTAKKIIKRIGGHVLSHDDPEKLARQIINIVKIKSLLKIKNKNFINKFSNTQVGKQVLKTLFK